MSSLSPSLIDRQSLSRRQIEQERIIRDSEDESEEAIEFIRAIHEIFPNLARRSEYRALQAAGKNWEIRQRFRSAILQLLLEQQYARNNPLGIDGRRFVNTEANTDEEMWRDLTWLAFAAEKTQTDCTSEGLREILKSRYDSGTDTFPRIVVARHIVPQRCFVYEDLVEHWLGEQQLSHHMQLDWPLNSASVYMLPWPVWPTISEMHMTAQSMLAFAEYAEGLGDTDDRRIAAYLRSAARVEQEQESRSDRPFVIPESLRTTSDAREYVVGRVWGTRQIEPTVQQSDETFTLDRWNEKRATETLWHKFNRFSSQSDERKQRQYEQLIPLALNRLVSCGANSIRDNLYAKGYIWDQSLSSSSATGQWQLLATADSLEQQQQQQQQQQRQQQATEEDITFWFSLSVQSCYLEAWLVAALATHREMMKNDEQYARRIAQQESLDRREEKDISYFPDATVMLEKVDALISLGMDLRTLARFDNLAHLNSSYHRSSLRWLVMGGFLSKRVAETLDQQFTDELTRREMLVRARAERREARRMAAQEARERADSSFLISVNSEPTNETDIDEEESDNDDTSNAQTFWQFLFDSQYARTGGFDVDVLYRLFLQDEAKSYARRWFQRATEGHFDPCNGNKLGVQAMHETFDAFMSTSDVQSGNWGVAASTTMLRPLPRSLREPTALPKPVPSPKWLPYGTRNPQALNGLDVTFELQQIVKSTEQDDGSVRRETFTPDAFRSIVSTVSLDSTYRLILSVAVQNNSSKTYQGGQVRVLVDVRQKDFVGLLAQENLSSEFVSKDQVEMYLRLETPLVPGETRPVDPDTTTTSIALTVKTVFPAVILDSLVETSLRGQVLPFSPPLQTGYSVWTYSSVVSLQRNRLAKRLARGNVRDALLLTQPTVASALIPYSRTVWDANGTVARSIYVAKPKVLTVFSDQILSQIRFDEYIVIHWRNEQQETEQEQEEEAGVYRLSAAIIFDAETSRFVTVFRIGTQWFRYDATKNEGQSKLLTLSQFRQTLYCQQSNTCQAWYTNVTVDQTLPTPLTLQTVNSPAALISANESAQQLWQTLTAEQRDTTMPTISPPYVAPSDKTTRIFLERQVAANERAESVSQQALPSILPPRSRLSVPPLSTGAVTTIPSAGRTDSAASNVPRRLRATSTFSVVFVPFLYSAFDTDYDGAERIRALVGPELWDRLLQIARQHYRDTQTALADLNPQQNGYIPAHMQEWALGAPRTVPSPPNSPHYMELRVDGDGGLQTVGHGDYANLDLLKHVDLAATVGTPLNVRAAQLAREGKI